ncbi:hypothetical protein ACFS07_04915 [Undibacterium arcticum]
MWLDIMLPPDGMPMLSFGQAARAVLILPVVTCSCRRGGDGDGPFIAQKSTPQIEKNAIVFIDKDQLFFYDATEHFQNAIAPRVCRVRLPLLTARYPYRAGWTASVMTATRL